MIITPRENPKLYHQAGRLVILLDELDPVFHSRGVYGSTDDVMPKRYRYLDAQAHESLVSLEHAFPNCFYFSDVFRNATGSKGRREKNKARRGYYTGKKPGTSAHSFGLAFDLHVDRTLRNLDRHLDARLSKPELDEILKLYGWWCHRDGPNGGDNDRGSEDWHYNFFGDDPERWLEWSNCRTSGGIEAKIQYMHGPFTLSRDGVVEHLCRLGYMQFGTTITKSMKQFQRDWTLTPDGIAGLVTQRTLLYVGAELRRTDLKPFDVAPVFP